MSDRNRTANEIQWRNIRKVVRALADLCFESPEHPKYGTCHTALTTSLTAKDGLGPIDLEPLPDTASLTAELARVKAERDAALKKFHALKEVFYINMLRAFPKMSHEEIAKEIDAAIAAREG